MMLEENLMKAVEILILGWGGIFVVMLILFAVIKVLLSLDSRKSS